MTRRSVGVVVALAALVAAGCGSSKSASTATTASPQTTVAPGTSSSSVAGTGAQTSAPTGPVDVQSGDFPDTPIIATLDQTYRNHGLSFSATDFAVPAGSVTAAWYIVGETWAVYYRGLTKEQAIDKCPGNSIKTATDFEHVTNSPYGALACKNFTGEVLPPGSLHLCGGTAIVYTTAIPTSATGTLYGRLEQGLFDGSIQGMTSAINANTVYVPTIDVSRCDVIS